jgi:hypothetical protein
MMRRVLLMQNDPPNTLKDAKVPETDASPETSSDPDLFGLIWRV